MLILAVKRYKFFISARPLAAAEFLGAENLRLTPFAVKFFAAENQTWSQGHKFQGQGQRGKGQGLDLQGQGQGLGLQGQGLDRQGQGLGPSPTYKVKAKEGIHSTLHHTHYSRII